MPYTPPPDLASLSLAEIAELVKQRKLPPVDQWNPEAQSDSFMRITADGRWFHKGGQIKRPAMIRAFSSLLRCDDDGQHWLVTPYEKQSIEVEDAPFIAVEVRTEGEGDNRQLVLRLNSDDLVLLDGDHPLVMREQPQEDGAPPLPYVNVRGNLWAKLARPVYYELAEMALAENADSPGLWSSGSYFTLGSSI
ncbi:DUF1285 domain-containing protein [Sphingorhabdus arenilitoris]|uniref:DUF1285 domain-containing protein n=1 Tax=Sphingorhabdus arenilitoris TaxID=1490041 RepID=A0ABV8RG50_9SPHN